MGRFRGLPEQNDERILDRGGNPSRSFLQLSVNPYKENKIKTLRCPVCAKKKQGDRNRILYTKNLYKQAFIETETIANLVSMNKKALAVMLISAIFISLYGIQAVEFINANWTGPIPPDLPKVRH